jgi:hypothetical protein
MVTTFRFRRDHSSLAHSFPQYCDRNFATGVRRDAAPRYFILVHSPVLQKLDLSKEATFLFPLQAQQFFSTGIKVIDRLAGCCNLGTSTNVHGELCQVLPYCL